MSCACEACRKECERRPGWFAPGEAIRAIEAGHADRLTIVVDHAGVPAIAPIGDGPFGFIGRCTFFKNDRCEIHDSGFKPIECRMGYICKQASIPETAVYRMWKTRLGRQALSMLRLAKGDNSQEKEFV